MQEENNDIDNFFRDKLDNFEANPPERVWNSIATELDKKKKTRGFWLFGFLILAGIISAGSYMYLNRDSGTSKPKNDNAAGLINESASTVVEDAAQATSGSAGEEKAISESGKKDADAVEAGTVSKGKTMAQVPMVRNNIPEEKIDINPKKVSGISKTSSEAQGESGTKKSGNILSASTDNNTSIIKSTTISTATSTGTSTTTSTTTSTSTLAPTSANTSTPTSTGISRRSEVDTPEATGDLQNTSTKTAKAEEESGSVDKKEKQFTENSPAASTQSKQPDQSLPPDASGSMASKKESIHSDSEPSESLNAASPSATAGNELASTEKSATPAVLEKMNLLKRIGSNASIGIFYSPDYSNERMTGTQYAAKTAHGYSWTSGLKLGYDIGRRWSISSGLSYSHLSKSETYSVIYVASDSAFFHMQHDEGHDGDDDDDEGDDDEGGPANNGNHYVLHTSYGDYDLNQLPEESNGEEESGETINQKSEVVSSFASINIPLKVRFNISTAKLGYYVEAGAQLSHISSSTSKINTGNHIESGSVKGLNKNYYSLLLNLGIDYRFYKGLSLFIEPGLRYSITPLLESTSAKAYPYFIGGNIGLSIHF